MILFLRGPLNRILLEFVRRDENVDIAGISNDVPDDFGRLAPETGLLNFWLVLVPILGHIAHFHGDRKLKRRVLDVEGGKLVKNSPSRISRWICLH